jgi:hypothetical protein
MKKTRILFLGVAALALAACGHNGSDSGATQQQAEDSAASATVAGLVAFGQAQIVRADADASEPRPIGGVNPPVSDVDEPVAI